MFRGYVSGRHHPPPGRRIAPPDDRLQRMIQYSEAPVVDREAAVYWIPASRV